MKLLTCISRHIPTLSIILLTHPTPSHIAAFAHCCKHFPLFTQIPIYATSPVISFGRTLLQDIYASTPLASTVIPLDALGESGIATSSEAKAQILLQPPTAEEITSYFALINPLRYSQPHQPLPSPFSPPLNGLTITAYNAGHTLGGTIWHIQHGMESVVYAVDWNLARENVIGGAAWLGGGIGGGTEVIEQLRKPTALVCSSKGVQRTPQAASKIKRDELLLEMIRNALGNGGTVLIPSDSSARVLELAWLLENAWRRGQGSGDVLRGTRAYLASSTIASTIDFTKSMVEWMDENVTKTYESEAENRPRHKRSDSRRNNEKHEGEGGDQVAGPFSFKYLKLVERKSRIQKLLQKPGPKLIVASDSSLDWGLSRGLLKYLARDPNNLVILTNDFPSAQAGQVSLGQTLWNWYQLQQSKAAKVEGNGHSWEIVQSGQELTITESSRTTLEGKELAMYQQYQATQRQLLNVQRDGTTNLEDANDVIEDDASSSSSEEESGDEQQGKSLNLSGRLLQAGRNKAAEDKEIQGINAILRKPGCYDWDVRGKKGREAVFPFVNKRKRIDEFGELIRPEDYLRAEERDEIEGRDLRDSPDGKKSGLGEKRKWGDTKMANNEKAQTFGKFKRQRLNSSSRYNRGQQFDEANGASESSDESDSEDEKPIVGPSKLVVAASTIPINCGITYIDFSGLHDQRSLSMLIPLIQPRKVVVIGGNEAETRWLAEECRQKLHVRADDDSEVNNILTPTIGETVQASMDTHAWTVKLSRDLVRRIQWQDVRGLGVVTLMGRLTPTLSEQAQAPQKRKRQKLEKEESATPALEPEEKQDLENLPPTLDILPANLAAATRSAAQPVHVGDLRLADLRKMLQSTGHMADFRGEGTLVVDNLVAVRKSASGQIELETSGLTLPQYMNRNQESPFHTVRRRIYEGLAVIAGG